MNHHGLVEVCRVPMPNGLIEDIHLVFYVHEALSGHHGARAYEYGVMEDGWYVFYRVAVSPLTDDEEETA